MSDISYELFLPHVLPYVPNAPDIQVVNAVRNTCIEFCQNTLVLQQDLDAISTVAGVGDYDIDVPSGYTLTQVVSLYYKLSRLERKSQTELEKLYTRDWQQISGTPKCFTMLTPAVVTLVLNPSESAANALTGRIAYVPSRASLTIDPDLLERYAEHISFGTLFRLLTTPNEPYTDMQSAAYYGTKFRSMMATTKALVLGGNNHAPMRVRFNRIW